MNFENILNNYQSGSWNKTMVKVAVKKGVITPEQYAEITGEQYTK